MGQLVWAPRADPWSMRAKRLVLIGLLYSPIQTDRDYKLFSPQTVCSGKHEGPDQKSPEARKGPGRSHTAWEGGETHTAVLPCLKPDRSQIPDMIIGLSEELDTRVDSYGEVVFHRHPISRLAGRSCGDYYENCAFTDRELCYCRPTRPPRDVFASCYPGPIHSY